jgi:hypothetical protein
MVPDTAILLSPMRKVGSDWHTDIVEPRDNWFPLNHPFTWFKRYVYI